MNQSAFDRSEVFLIALGVLAVLAGCILAIGVSMRFRGSTPSELSPVVGAAEPSHSSGNSREDQSPILTGRVEVSTPEPNLLQIQEQIAGRLVAGSKSAIVRLYIMRRSDATCFREDFSIVDGISISARALEPSRTLGVRGLQVFNLLYCPQGFRRTHESTTATHVIQAGQIRDALVVKGPSNGFRIVDFGKQLPLGCPTIETAWPQAFRYLGRARFSVVEAVVEPRSTRSGLPLFDVHVRAVLWSSTHAEVAKHATIAVVATSEVAAESLRSARGLCCLAIEDNPIPGLKPLFRHLWTAIDASPRKHYPVVSGNLAGSHHGSRRRIRPPFAESTPRDSAEIEQNVGPSLHALCFHLPRSERGYAARW